MNDREIRFLSIVVLLTVIFLSGISLICFLSLNQSKTPDTKNENPTVFTSLQLDPSLASQVGTPSAEFRTTSDIQIAKYLTPIFSITQESIPLATETTVPDAPVIGGADKIAYLSNNDIWIANLDGSGLSRLTKDQAEKTSLQWTPDGKSLNFIQSKCIKTIDIQTRSMSTISCFKFIDYLKAFEISPDGRKIAISLDNQLYIVPYDLDKLAKSSIRSDLTEFADCENFAPFLLNYVKTVRWSKDGNLIAAVVIGVGDIGIRSDIIRVFDVSKCTPNPRILDSFPSSSRFKILNFEKRSEIQNFGWDGLALFALTSALRNGGFGDLYIYNMELHEAQIAINPIDSSCCYRDPQWSPDGNDLLFAFQDSRLYDNATTQIFFIDPTKIGTGYQFIPLPLPNLIEIKAKPQMALRPTLPNP